MTRIINARVVALLLLVAAYPSAALAWGREGHQVVAILAQERMTPAALAAARELLTLEGAHDLKDVANWADEIRNGHLPAGTPRHSTRLPLDTEPADFKAVCVKKYPCATWGITQEADILRDRSRPAQERLDALKFVVHLVGDVHQPLHSSIDTGEQNVQLDGKDYSLHKVWDTIFLRKLKRSPEDIASVLDQRAEKSPVQAGGTPEDWTVESRDIARDRIFPELSSRGQDGTAALPSDYLNRNRPIVYDRLTQAGMRLAKTLNEALDAQP